MPGPGIKDDSLVKSQNSYGIEKLVDKILNLEINT